MPCVHGYMCASKQVQACMLHVDAWTHCMVQVDALHACMHGVLNAHHIASAAGLPAQSTAGCCSVCMCVLQVVPDGGRGHVHRHCHLHRQSFLLSEQGKFFAQQRLRLFWPPSLRSHTCAFFVHALLSNMHSHLPSRVRIGGTLIRVCASPTTWWRSTSRLPSL